MLNQFLAHGRADLAVRTDIKHSVLDDVRQREQLLVHRRGREGVSRPHQHPYFGQLRVGGHHLTDQPPSVVQLLHFVAVAQTELDGPVLAVFSSDGLQELAVDEGVSRGEDIVDGGPHDAHDAADEPAIEDISVGGRGGGGEGVEKGWGRGGKEEERRRGGEVRKRKENTEVHGCAQTWQGEKMR